MAPVVALSGESIDNNLIVHGCIDSSDPTAVSGGNSQRLFVLRPDSREWDEWRLPDDDMQGAVPDHINWRNVRSYIAMSAVRLGRVIIAPTSRLRRDAAIRLCCNHTYYQNSRARRSRP